MNRRPTRCGGGRIGGPSYDHKDKAAASSLGHKARNSGATDVPSDSFVHLSQLNRDELDRLLEDVINNGAADGGYHILDSTTPTGSYISSSSSTNAKGVCKGLALGKGNRSRGDQFEVEISAETGRPSLQHQAQLACRECLPLFGDERNVDVDLKKMTFERMNDKFIQFQNDVLASDKSQTNDEIVDKVMNAANQSDCRPNTGYGPKVVGRSSKRLCSKQHLRTELLASQKKNDELSQKIKKLMESQAKLAKEMAQIKAYLILRLQNTSENGGHLSPSQNPSTRVDDVQ